MRYVDLKSTLMRVLKVRDKTAERKVREWQDLGVIEKGIAGLWTRKTCENLPSTLNSPSNDPHEGVTLTPSAPMYVGAGVSGGRRGFSKSRAP
jgi:hypothetical protein